MDATQLDESFWRGRAEELQYALNSRVVVEHRGSLQRAARRGAVRACESP
jgi:hypothetical protein